MFLTPLPPSFDAALRDVNARDPKFRLSAAQALGDAPESRRDEAARGLVTLCADALGPLRAAAVRSLGRLERELPVLLARLDDEHREVRQAAIRAAAELDEDRLSWLPALAQSDHPDVRFEALDALATHAPSACLEVARALLGDPVDDVRGAAARTLGALDARGSEDAIAALLEDTLDVARSAAVALAELQDARGEDVLIAALGDRGWRLEAAEALGAVATAEGRDALAARADAFFGSLLDKAAAAAALARLGDARGEPALHRVLTAWRADGRDYAVQVVGELHLSRLIPALAALARRLRGADPNVLAQALAQFADDQEASAALATLHARGLA